MNANQTKLLFNWKLIYSLNKTMFWFHKNLAMMCYFCWVNEL